MDSEHEEVAGVPGLVGDGPRERGVLALSDVRLRVVVPLTSMKSMA